MFFFFQILGRLVVAACSCLLLVVVFWLLFVGCRLLPLVVFLHSPPGEASQDLKGHFASVMNRNPVELKGRICSKASCDSAIRRHSPTTNPPKGTLPETNMAPENNALEKEIPIGNHHF